MRVVITGAGGFVGGFLLAHLKAILPDAVLIGATQPGLPMPPPMPGVTFAPCDITSALSVSQFIKQAQPDHLYHLAGAASGAADDREMVFAVNVDGTGHILEAVRSCAPHCRVLLAGTGYVYGNCSHPAYETDLLPPPESVGLYAESKRLAEDVARESEVDVVLSRAFNHTGPGQTIAFSVPAFAAQIVGVERGTQMCLSVGNLEAVRDFLDVRDVVRAYVLLLAHGAAGEAYNVCSGRGLAMRGVLDDLVALARVPVPIAPDAARLRSSDIGANIGNPTKLMALTGWHPVIPFVQTLSDTLDWWRKQPA